MRTQHQHDCAICIFLGNFTVSSGGDVLKYDGYICPGEIPTVLARYGSDGPEYVSRSYESFKTLNPAAMTDYWVAMRNLMEKKERP